MQYFDTHAHYYDNRFALESEGGAMPLLARLFEDNVCGIVNVATCPDNYMSAIGQAKAFPKMYTALGIHPTDCQTLQMPCDAYMEELHRLLKDPLSKAVALGEIGLDYHYENTQKQKQTDFLHAQLSLACELDIPVVIHDRDAHGDCMDILSQYPRVRGIMHSFSGSAEMAKELLRHNFYISFSGPLTYKDAKKTVETAKIVPHDRVLIETDAPYLPPVPHRGELNHSGYLVYTNQMLAECLCLSCEETSTLTAQNAKTLFNIKNP